MHQAGPFNPTFGVESFGLKDLKSISYNLQAPRLVEDAIRRGEAMVAKGGALSAETGDAVTDKTVWWDNNKAKRRKRSMCCMPTCSAKGMELYAQYLYGGTRWVQFVC
jgi:phosphoenolpyruvate carboxykinase (ATP)